VGVGALSASRFGRRDAGGFADVYHTLWRRAYGNVRVQVLPGADVLPVTDVGVEIFQGLAGGWEPSVGYRFMTFENTDVHITSASAARFLGPWYSRVRLSHATSGNLADGSLSAAGLLRRYLVTDDATQFVEAGAGVGGEAVTTGVGAIDVRRTSFVTVSGQRYVRRTLGLGATITHATFEGIPRRTGASVSLLARW